MESYFVSLVMLGLVAAMVVARLWVQGRIKEGTGEVHRVEGRCDRGRVAEGWEEKGDVCEWWS
jgi:hypothetical protein